MFFSLERDDENDRHERKDRKTDMELLFLLLSIQVDWLGLPARWEQLKLWMKLTICEGILSFSPSSRKQRKEKKKRKSTVAFSVRDSEWVLAAIIQK